MQLICQESLLISTLNSNYVKHGIEKHCVLCFVVVVVFTQPFQQITGTFRTITKVNTVSVSPLFTPREVERIWKTSPPLLFQSVDRKKVQRKTQFVDTPWPRIWHKRCKSVCAPQGIYCAFQTEQPADREEAEEGDVRHSRIRRQGGRKAGLAREQQAGCCSPSV